MVYLGYAVVGIAWGVFLVVLVKEYRDQKRDREGRAARIEGLGLKRLK